MPTQQLTEKQAAMRLRYLDDNPPPVSPMPRALQKDFLEALTDYQAAPKRLYAGRMRTEAQIQRKREQSHRYHRAPIGRYSTLKSNPRKLEVGITPQEHEELLEQPCHYCNGPLDETGTGLDRLDHARGYMRDNVVPCCGCCNTAKGLLERFGTERLRRFAESMGILSHLSNCPLCSKLSTKFSKL